MAQAEISLRQPIQGFLRECQILLDTLDNNERLTPLEVVLMKAYVKRLRTYLMSHETDLPHLSPEEVSTAARRSGH